jgi:hypothetical protein
MVKQKDPYNYIESDPRMAAVSVPIVTARGSLDHLGIVAGIYDELSIGAIWDRPGSKKEERTMRTTTKRGGDGDWVPDRGGV